MRTKIRIAWIFILCMVSWGMDAQNTSAPISQADLDKVGGRRALVGPNCMINQLATSANLLTNYDRLDAVTDEDLNNFTTILGVRNRGPPHLQRERCRKHVRRRHAGWI